MTRDKLFPLLLTSFIARQCAASTELPATDKDAELEKELKFLAAERRVVVFTASKMEERQEKTVATTSVITQAEIQRMGARNLLDVLRRVPGIGVTESSLGIRQIEVRGIKTDFSEKVLFLLNGHPLDQNLNNAGSVWVYDDLPVDTIQRVEVVRGPGSALYGANAFLAVVNIITSGVKDFDGVQTSARWGSFDTQQYRASWSGHDDNTAEAAIHFNFNDTNGIAAPVPADALSAEGKPSLAPGLSQLTETRYDLEWQLGYQGFKLDGRYIDKRMGAFVGPNYDLSNNTAQNYENYFIRLSRDWQATEDFTVGAQAYYDSFNFNNLLQMQPPAGTPPQFFRAALTNTRTGGELQGTYRFSETNTLISGISYASEQQYGVSQDAGSYPKELSAIAPFSRSIGRDRWGVYTQDVWDPFENLRLTLGARYDHYTDFGGTFNPRLGFNWEFIKDYSLKFSYGTAFRAPAFGELTLMNNLALAGNPDLKPEQIETFEAGIIAQPMPGLTAQAIFYHSHISEVISQVLAPQGPAIYEYANRGSLTSQGVELEGRYDFGEFAPGSYVAMNYTYQNPTNQQGQFLFDVPHNRANLMLNWAFDSHWSAFANVLVKSQTGRAPGDSRKDTPGYAVVNLSLLSRRLFWEGLDMSFTVYNLLDKQYFDPAPVPMPVDYQNAERSYFGHVSFKF